MHDRTYGALHVSGFLFGHGVQGERRPAFVVVAVHHNDVHEADGLERASYDIERARLGALGRLVRRRPPDRARPARGRRRASARRASPAPLPAVPSRLGGRLQRAFFRISDPHLDKAVAGVIEIAATDRDIVEQPRRRRRIDRKQRRRHRLVVEVERPAVLLPDLLAGGRLVPIRARLEAFPGSFSAVDLTVVGNVIGPQSGLRMGLEFICGACRRRLAWGRKSDLAPG